MRRLGVASKDEATDAGFVQATFHLLRESKSPWPSFWHDWRGGADRADGLQLETYEGQGWTAWRKDFAAFDPISARPETDRAASVLYEDIGALWAPITTDDDWSGFETKLKSLSHPV